MKIKETVERDCCYQKDLKPYQGQFTYDTKIYFCQYCGEHWFYERKMDAAGSMDSDLVRLKYVDKVKVFPKKKYTILKWVGNLNGIATVVINNKLKLSKIGHVKIKLRARNWEECFSTDSLEEANARMSTFALNGVCAALYQDGVNISVNFEKGAGFPVEGVSP